LLRLIRGYPSSTYRPAEVRKGSSLL
jgi:hypothetical protein